RTPRHRFGAPRESLLPRPGPAAARSCVADGGASKSLLASRYSKATDPGCRTSGLLSQGLGFCALYFMIGLPRYWRFAICLGSNRAYHPPPLVVKQEWAIV